jgi:hypothetical protein
MANRKHFSSSIRLSLLSLTILMLSIQSFAQSQNQPTVDSNTKNENQPTNCSVFVVIVKVEVRNQYGEEVADLRKDDFIIYEDGVRQEIIFWRRNEGSDRRTQQALYEVGYYPINYQFEGEFRKLRISVQNKGKRKLRVEFSPKGYYAKKELIK